MLRNKLKTRRLFLIIFIISLLVFGCCIYLNKYVFPTKGYVDVHIPIQVESQLRTNFITRVKTDILFVKLDYYETHGKNFDTNNVPCDLDIEIYSSKTKEVLLKTNVYSLSFDYSDTIGKLVNLEKGNYDVLIKNRKSLTEATKLNDQIPRLRIDIASSTKKDRMLNFFAIEVLSIIAIGMSGIIWLFKRNC